MEKLQAHDLEDIYRLEYGVILEVRKYETNKDIGHIWDVKRSHKDKVKAVKGIKRCFEVIKEIPPKYSTDKTFPVGTIILNDWAVKAVKDPSKFKYELKFSGGSYFGEKHKLLKLFALVHEITKSYEEGLV